MRGKVKQVSEAMVKARITPAYAGKSFVTVFVLNFGEDHPRLCGEKL